MKFNDLKEKLEKLFFKDDVKKMLLYSLIDKDFYDFLSNLVIEEIDSMLEIIYKEELKIIDSIKEEKEEFFKYELSIKLENYFSLIEFITEKSVFSKNLIDDFKSEFGEDYLKFIEKIDNGDTINISSSLIDRYLLIKKWQDKHNNLGRLVIEDLLSDVNYFYEDLNSYIFFKLREKKVLDMSFLLNLYSILSKESLLLLIGGKCYGLVKLYSIGINIPLTYVCLTDTNVILDDIDFLDKSVRYSVRSSATIEDGDKYSFAGMFNTYLDVKYDDLIKRIKEVKESVNSIQVKKYMEDNNLNNANMAVVIQEFNNVDYSGIWFGINENEGIYEYINDIGEKLVSGSTSADRVKYKKGDNYFLDNINIGEVFVKIQNIFHEICDLEWCIINNELFLLQYRAITKNVDIFINDEETLVDDGDIKGLGVSPGEIEGKIYYLEEIDDNIKLESNSILLTTKTDVSWMGILNNVKGLITYKGSLLCHAAIIAREIGISCITDLSKEDYLKLQQANIVRMNGKTGVIKIIN